MFDPAIVQIILAGVGGLTVLAITELIKRWLNASGLGAYLISLAVSAAATAYYLVSSNTFTVLAFIGYTAFVFVAANGIYKAAVKGVVERINKSRLG